MARDSKNKRTMRRLKRQASLACRSVEQLVAIINTSRQVPTTSAVTLPFLPDVEQKAEAMAEDPTMPQVVKETADYGNPHD